MQILIHGPPLWPQDAEGPSAYPDELFLLELQGSLETSEQGADELDGQTMGTIEWPEGKNKGPVLRIGHHRLEGKLVQLPQPLAVIRKRDDPEDEDDELEENGMDSEDAHMAQVRRRRRAAIGGLVGFTSSAPPSSNAITAPTSPSKEAERRGTQVDYDVLTIIRYKYHFKNRPEISVSEAHRGANQLIDKRPKAV